MYSKRLIALTVLVAMLAMGVSSAIASEPSYTEVWDGRGTDSLNCAKIGEGPRTADGWIHWVFSTKGDSTSAILTVNGMPYEPGPPLTAETWHFYTPYIDVNAVSASISLFGGAPGSGGGLVISDYCPGAAENLDVSKTAVTSFEREHFWDIDKKVETEEKFEKDGYPKVWLYTDGSGDETATWTVDVTYEGYEDSDFNVSGVITITNNGQLDAVITSIVDELAGDEIAISCDNGFTSGTLPVGQTLNCSYSEDVDMKIEGSNVVTVTTERDTYSGSADIIWGGPTNEINATVNVQDISGLFGAVDLGSVTQPNGDSFTYDRDFEWEYYGAAGCAGFTYNNTATILETGQSASAKLKVNVQCLIFDGETAWAANEDTALQNRYTNRGNWATYVQYAPKTTTLFAGQTIPVGTVTFGQVVDGMVTIEVNLDEGWEFQDVAENLKVQGYASAPSGNPAPGRFNHKVTCDAADDECSIMVPANNFYGVHVNVGQWIPDPNFGPQE